MKLVKKQKHFLNASQHKLEILKKSHCLLTDPRSIEFLGQG